MTNIANPDHLTRFIADHLPLGGHLGLRVATYDAHTLALAAPLAPNRNDKATAFGGSLYCTCVMACWGMLYLKTVAKEIDADIVVAQGSINYFAPVDNDFVAQCTVPEKTSFNRLFTDFSKRGKASIALTSSIAAHGKTAVAFEGKFSLLRR